MSVARRNPQLFDLYQRYLDGQDTGDFIELVGKVYNQGALQRLVENDVPQVRRAAVLALGFLGDYAANHTLGRSLQDEDRTVRMLSETALRNVWQRDGGADDRQRLAAIIRLNASQQYREAIDRAGELIKASPWFAEAWNQRAVAHYALLHFAESIRDCHQALEVNPYHFAAAAGMGHAYLKLGNKFSALESFRRALRLNPDLEAVRAQVARLSRLLEDRGA